MPVRRFMFDTNAASMVIKTRPADFVERVAARPMSDFCISAIVEGELRFGVAKRPDATQLAQAVSRFLMRIDILAWNSAAAEIYGRLRAHLQASGRPIGHLDTLIAAHALAEHAVLVTRDRAFARVPGLTVEDWQTA